MNSPQPDMVTWLSQHGQDLLAWVQEQFFSFDSLWQLLAMAVAGGLASLLARPAKRFFLKEGRTERIQWVRLAELAFPIIWVLLLVLVRIGFEQYELASPFIRVVHELLFAWATIQLITCFMRRSQFARMLASGIWVMAALSILGLLHPVAEFLDAIAITLGKARVSLLDMMKSAAVLGALLWGAGALARLVEGTLRQSDGFSPSVQELMVKVARITLIFVAFLAGLSALGIDLTAFALFSGALGIGLGFGLQKIIANFMGGFLLLFEGSIKPGDVIAVDQTFGWVNRLGARYVSVITREGKEHLIPNELLITQKVENWSHSHNHVRLSTDFRVDFRHDPKQVQKVALAAIKGTPRLLEKPKPLCLLKEFGPYALVFELRFWISDPQNGVGNVTSDVLIRLWDALKEGGIHVPYPYQEVMLRRENTEENHL